MDPLTAHLANLDMGDTSSDLDKPTIESVSNHQHNSNSAVNGIMTVTDGPLLAHASSNNSLAGNSDEIAAAEAADVLSPLGSPTAVSTPITIPGSKELSSITHSGDSSPHHHFTPDISYPKSGLGLSPHSSSPGAVFLTAHGAESAAQTSTTSSSNGSHLAQSVAVNGAGHSSSSIPPRSPPDPDLDPEVLGQLLQKHASPAVTDKRFSMDEFLKNKARMATAARRELGGGHTAANDDDVGSCLEGSGHVAELSRQAAHLSSVTEGVAEESKVNSDLAALMMERLDSSKR
eukprot:GHUV01015514.1.p1 GENE.GHUV01015514.1~~GHUV01015514.1.p1  ORF type:complete len:290 (+),score=104.15 GHUV01015514.1:618-1487(+)